MPGLHAKCQCSSQVPSVLPDVARMWLPLCRVQWQRPVADALRPWASLLSSVLGDPSTQPPSSWTQLQQGREAWCSGLSLDEVVPEWQLKQGFYLQLRHPSLAWWPSSPSILSWHFTIGREERQEQLFSVWIVNTTCAIMTYQANIRDK